MAMLNIERHTDTINPIIAHLPMAFALIGVLELKTMYKINPIIGKKNDKMFNPDDTTSGSMLEDIKAQPHLTQTMASSLTCAPQC